MYSEHGCCAATINANDREGTIVSWRQHTIFVLIKNGSRCAVPPNAHPALRGDVGSDYWPKRETMLPKLVKGPIRVMRPLQTCTNKSPRMVSPMTKMVAPRPRALITAPDDYVSTFMEKLVDEPPPCHTWHMYTVSLRYIPGIY